MLNAPSQRRRVINTLVLLVACVVAYFGLNIISIALANPSEWSGWVLLASCVLLLIYAARKRLSTLPLGRVAHWLQVHLYLGVFCLFVFFLHTDWGLPNGWFEVGLAICFIGTIVTGLLGIYWSRTLPTEITRLDDEVIYERIPGFVNRLRDQAEAEILAAVESSGSQALSSFYQREGAEFFASPRFLWRTLIRNRLPSRKTRQSLRLSFRYMASEELEHAQKLEELIEQKNRLDAHYTWQGVLKHWLFVHLAFAFSLVPLVFLHVVLAYAFSIN